MRRVYFTQQLWTIIVAFHLPLLRAMSLGFDSGSVSVPIEEYLGSTIQDFEDDFDPREVNSFMLASHPHGIPENDDFLMLSGNFLGVRQDPTTIRGLFHVPHEEEHPDLYPRRDFRLGSGRGRSRRDVILDDFMSIGENSHTHSFGDPIGTGRVDTGLGFVDEYTRQPEVPSTLLAPPRRRFPNYDYEESYDNDDYEESYDDDNFDGPSRRRSYDLEYDRPQSTYRSRRRTGRRPGTRRYREYLPYPHPYQSHRDLFSGRGFSSDSFHDGAVV